MLARAWPSVARGSQVMRPLTYEGPRGGMSPLARGGNVVFFDRDALTATPFPAHRADDGVVTRRADSLAALLTNGSWCARALDLPVLHGRQNEDGSSPMSSGARGNSALATFVEAQTRGIALTRALAKGEKSSVAEELSRRRQLHLDGFAAGYAMELDRHTGQRSGAAGDQQPCPSTAP